ncbi:MAG TPA: hypothetical protein VGF20_03380, partial [Candidatus Acidoferrum sp.]
MKRFVAVCSVALLAILFVAGCNDYGNTFQGNTGASLTSISPSVISAGGADMTLTLFGGGGSSAGGSGFATGTVAQWNGSTLKTTPVLDINMNIIYLTAVVPAALTAKPGVATVNTLSPHSGSGMNGLSNSLALII